MDRTSAPVGRDHEHQLVIDGEVAFTGRTWRLFEQSTVVLVRTNRVLCDSDDRLAVASARIAETRRRIVSSRLKQARYG